MDKRKKFLLMIAVYSVYFVGLEAAFINPVIQLMIEAYPDVAVTTVRTVSTINNIVGCVSGLLFSFIVGKKMKYKTCMLISLIFCTVGGLMPMFLNENFSMVLFGRAIFGFGAGGYLARNAMLAATFPKNEVPRLLGLGTTIGTIGGMIGQQLSGILGDALGWEGACLMYLINIPVILVFAFLFKEPEGVNEQPVAKTVENTVAPARDIDNVSIIRYAAMTLLTCLLLYPLLSGMSTLISARELGSAAQSGTASSLYSLSGIIGGLIFGAFINRFGKRQLSFNWAVIALGYVVILLANNLFTIFIGAFLCGYGNYYMTPTCTTYMNEVVSDKKRGFCTTIVLVSMSLGVFVSNYWIALWNSLLSGLFQTDVERSYLASAICAAILCAIYLIRDPRTKVVVEEEKARRTAK